MLLVGLDLASSTGVAVGDTGSRPVATTERLGNGEGTPHAARFYQAMVMIDAVVRAHQPDCIAIEKPIAAGVAGGEERVQLAMGWRAVAAIVAHKRGVRFLEYDVQAIRSYFVGPGARVAGHGKPLTMKRCRQLNWHVRNDNEADACAVWAYARAQLLGVHVQPAWGLFDG